MGRRLFVDLRKESNSGHGIHLPYIDLLLLPARAKQSRRAIDDIISPLMSPHVTGVHPLQASHPLTCVMETNRNG